jgi:hypothetical protein
MLHQEFSQIGESCLMQEGILDIIAHEGGAYVIDKNMALASFKRIEGHFDGQERRLDLT